MANDDLLKYYSIRVLRIGILVVLSKVFVLAYQQKESVVLSRVIDGDTIEIVKSKGTKERVRLIGVDCPESRNNSKLYRDSKKTNTQVKDLLKAGKLATEFVKSLVGVGDVLYLEYDVQHYDKYGRTLAYCYLSDGKMINEILLERGYAAMMTIPPNVKYVDRFLKAFNSGYGER